MNVQPYCSVSAGTPPGFHGTPKPNLPRPQAEEDETQLRKAFDAFAGEVVFSQMIKAMRKTVGKPAYFHGGRAEEIFQQQLDQVLGQKLTEACARQFSQPMYELFRLQRK